MKNLHKKENLIDYNFLKLGYTLERGNTFKESNGTVEEGGSETEEDEGYEEDERSQLYLTLRNVPPSLCPRNDAEAAAKVRFLIYFYNFLPFSQVFNI